MTSLIQSGVSPSIAPVRLYSAMRNPRTRRRTVTTIRVIALPTDTVLKVLTTMKSPGYGHPAHTELATGRGPCRHCLRPFRVGQEQRTLFTCNPFYQLAEIPLPGPVFVHTKLCSRYPEAGGYPPELRPFPVVLDGYSEMQRLVAQRKAAAESQEETIAEMFQNPDIHYVLVRDLEAGCFDFRVERAKESE